MGIECPECKTENTSDSQFCKKCATPLPLSGKVSVTKTLETPVQGLKKGTTFAERYEVLEELGKGGMGEVYRVKDQKLDEEMALKVLKPEIAADKGMIERFKNELKLARKIAHKSICKMYDLNEEEETPYITMEYVKGEDLKSFIRRKGKLTEEETIAIAKQVCEGLAEAHELGVIHRDLKPQNIMIDEKSYAKVMDFGIARSVEAPGVTQTGIMIGTPDYISPEQAEGEEADQRSDIYALGVILYEMVTGSVPFKGDTALSVALKHKAQLPKEPRKLNPEVSESLSRLILVCMEKDRERRYQKAEELLADLRNIEDGFPLGTKIRPRRKTFIATLIRKKFFIPSLVVALAVIAVVIWRLLPQTGPSLRENRVVVLPFENLGSPEEEYFADGITDEITARLIHISQLEVIARTSAYQYKNTNKSIRNIGEELDVDYILDGTIRWQRSPGGPSRVRVIPELIRASDSTNLWTEVYDKNIADIFEVQSAIAEQVAEALDITLAKDKRKALQTKPTTNIEAYNYYLQGIDYLNRGEVGEDVRFSIQMFERAIELDSNFTLAYTFLSRAYLFLYWLYYYKVDMSLVAKAREAVDKAHELSPNLPETHLAFGYYYYLGHLDYERALDHFNQSLKGMENSSDVLLGISYVQRRQGKYDQSTVNLKKAIDLDPRSHIKAHEIAQSYLFMRNYTESERYFNQAISLSPDKTEAYAWKMRLYLAWEGSTEKALKVIEEAPQTVQLSEEGQLILASIMVHMFNGNYQKVLDRHSLESSDAINTHICFVPKTLFLAQIYGLLDQSKLEQEHYDSARSFLEAKVQERPEDARIRSSLGIAYAGLGRKDEAIREGKKAVEFLSVTKDAFRGPFLAWDLARIYVMVGEHDAAIDQLEYLLSIPGEISIPLLKLDPAWEPLRDNLRFQKMIKQGK